MGGKGRRRREKNFLAAHGGNTRLPPPPNEKAHETLPSKLRKILQLKNFFATKHGATEGSVKTGAGERMGGTSRTKNQNLNESRSSTVIAKHGDNIMKTKNKLVKEKNTVAESCSADTKKRKRKRKSAKDLCLEDLNEFAKSSKKKERRKEYLKEKSNKRKKVKVNDELDFPGKENIRFGEVVKAPPKLSFPKVPKSLMDASTERLRLRAIEQYRDQKGWNSRPGGAKLPSVVKMATF